MMRHTTLHNSLCCTEPDIFGLPMLTPSCLQMELVRFYPAAPNGCLSIARNEHHRDEVKSLKGLSGQHMQPSQDVRPQAAFPLAHLPPPPLQTQLLWLRASFLPEEVDCCCWNCHGHLKRVSQSTGTATP